jgi:hypothetical protein
MKNKGKGVTTVDRKEKKNARLISRFSRNKPKPNIDQKPIVLSKDSDSDIEHFLAEEYPYSHGLFFKKPYDYVSNLPPCVKNDPNYPGIKMLKETPNNLNKPSPVMPKPNQSPCTQCNAWLEHYYTNISLLQSKIKSLEEQVTVLAKENDRLWTNEKKQKTTGSTVFRNIEEETTFVNSKLSRPSCFLIAQVLANIEQATNVC